MTKFIAEATVDAEAVWAAAEREDHETVANLWTAAANTALQRLTKQVGQNIGVIPTITIRTEIEV